MIFEKQWNALNQLDDLVHALAVDTIEDGCLTRKAQATICENKLESGVTFQLSVPAGLRLAKKEVGDFGLWGARPTRHKIAGLF
jgi:hypothetical protein